MKKIVVLLAMSLLLLTACGERYIVEGKVVSVNCSNMTKYYLKLDNGVAYNFKKTYCDIDEGVMVKIVHNQYLDIEKLVVEGTKEVGD